MIFKRLTSLLKLATFGACLLHVTALADIARAETIALSVPLSGDYAEIGRDFSLGAKLAMETIGRDHQLFIADDGCNPDLAKLAAKDIQSRNAALVTGMICNEAALTLANDLRESKTPLLVAGARSVRLIADRDREEWHIWRMSPGDDAAAEKLADYVTTNLRNTAFALIDDGTIYGRSITDTIRLQLNNTDMSPQFSDTFRAAQSTQAGLLRRLERSGVSMAIIAAATTEDLLTIAKNHKSMGIESKLILSEQISVLPFLEDADEVSDGILVVMIPPYSSNNRADPLSTLLEEKGITAKRAIYEGYAAIEVAVQQLSKPDNSFSGKVFETVIGSVEFDANGKNIQNPYRLHVWEDGALRPLNLQTSN